MVINLQILAMVDFCAAVHSFWWKRGCFTAIGKTKCRMQQAARIGTTIYQVFLDLRKAYNSVDRAAVLALMRQYRIGLQMR